MKNSWRAWWYEHDLMVAMVVLLMLYAGLSLVFAALVSRALTG